MERKIDELLAITYTIALLYFTGMESMPVWLRLVTAIGALMGGINLVLIWVLQWMENREKKRGRK